MTAATLASTRSPHDSASPGREALLRALAHRFSATVEAALERELARPGGPSDREAAVRAAYRRATALRPADRRVLHAEADHPVVAELTATERSRVAERAGLATARVAALAAEAARATRPVVRVRRRPARVLARRVG